MKEKRKFDPYDYYMRSVQSTAVDCQYISDTYRELRGRRPHSLREDFCGTFALCCEWVRRNRANVAYGVDLDNEPLVYGEAAYRAKLREDQQKRVRVSQGSVLTASLPRVDVVVALNFSYYLFKSRLLLKRYFKRALLGLRPGGLLIVDSFGGIACQEANEERSKVGNFVYYWEQANYDPVHNSGVFHIHLKLKGEKRRDRVFSYDWRLWTIPEIRETMLEAGFSRTHVYWEGTNRAGFGDGNFTKVETGEECESWVAYVVGER